MAVIEHLVQKQKAREIRMLEVKKLVRRVWKMVWFLKLKS